MTSLRAMSMGGASDCKQRVGASRAKPCGRVPRYQEQANQVYMCSATRHANNLLLPVCTVNFLYLEQFVPFLS